MFLLRDISEKYACLEVTRVEFIVMVTSIHTHTRWWFFLCLCTEVSVQQVIWPPRVTEHAKDVGLRLTQCLTESSDNECKLNKLQSTLPATEQVFCSLTPCVIKH